MDYRLETLGCTRATSLCDGAPRGPARPGVTCGEPRAAGRGRYCTRHADDADALSLPAARRARATTVRLVGAQLRPARDATPVARAGSRRLHQHQPPPPRLRLEETGGVGPQMKGTQ